MQDKPSSVSTLGKVERAAAEIEAAANARLDAAASGASAAGNAAVGNPADAAGRTALAAASHPATGARSQAKPSSPTNAANPANAANAANTERLKINLREYVLSGTLGALAFFGQAAVVFFIALFLLSTGNSFRRKMVKLAGPRFSQKKVTIETLDEITDQIQRYLLVQLAVSVLVGLATWAVFYAIGLEQSAVWGVVAGVTNLIPYLGAILVGAGSAVLAFVQFGTLEMALVVSGCSFAIRALIGNVLTPWCMGRASRMSPFAVFVAVLLFGWLWGVWGLLLGVPILMVVKSVCDRVDDLKPIGELLGA
jgi:predicted PurR-regulated permease PerM